MKVVEFGNIFESVKVGTHFGSAVVIYGELNGKVQTPLLLENTLRKIIRENKDKFTSKDVEVLDKILSLAYGREIEAFSFISNGSVKAYVKKNGKFTPLDL